METARPSPPNHGGFMRSLTKLLSFRRPTGSRNGMSPVGNGMVKVKLPDYFDGSSLLSQSEVNEEDVKKHVRSREAMESLLAMVFTSISAVKAAYAQLQVAQSPYDPDTIQSADRAVVAELKRLSHLKHSYFGKHFVGSTYPMQYQSFHHLPPRDSQLVAEIQEQRNLLKTFQITAKKLETDLQHKDSEITSLKEELQELETQSCSLEAKLHPHRSLSVLDHFHLSGLNPTHFLAALRYTVKSIRSFVKVMVQEMEASGWDLGAAAGSIEPEVLHGKPEHSTFAFQSYVCRTMFSDFQHPKFGLCDSHDRHRFFHEFVELKSTKPKQLLDDGRSLGSPFGEFCKAKYQSLVHPKMEASFFGNTDQGAVLLSGNGVPDTVFFLCFVEMAWRVWLMHLLFFSFDPEAETSIFQVANGARFSEVYMESVEEEAVAEVVRGTVGFTVVPGFKMQRTVVQCKVYLARRKDGDGR